MSKPKGRIKPRIDVAVLEENFVTQVSSGVVADASVANAELPVLESSRGQAVRMDRCLLQSVTLADPKARGLKMRDVRIDPIRKLAIVYRPGSVPETVMRPEFLEGEGPVEGFRLKMERFWA